MSDLETLKAQHPEWCFTCGKWHLEAGGIHTCFENPILAALLSVVQQHEAELAKAQETIAELRNNIRAEYARHLKANLAAAQATIRDLENKLAAARRHCPDHDHRGPATAHNCGHCLAEAQATIQQQARELEEADRALAMIANETVGDLGWQGTALAQRAHARAALARHSARSQQAEAKKEDEVVVLRERIEALMPDMEAINGQEMSVTALKEALVNTAALAEQRKREIQREALEAAVRRVEQLRKNPYWSRPLFLNNAILGTKVKGE